MSEKNTEKQENTQQETDEGRREALKKLGKYAYTAPVALSLLQSKKASAESPISPTMPGGPGGTPLWNPRR